MQALVSPAEERGADLIVVGSNGGQGKGLLLGSTAFGVTQRSPVPVVPPPA